MGNAEGAQQGKEPGNEPSDASGVSQQHVGSTSNGGSSPVSGGGVVDTASGGDFSISPGGAANVMEQLNSGELEEHPIEANLEADEVHSDTGFSMPAVNSWLNDADEEINGRVGVGMSEAGTMREPCLRGYGMVSNGDEEGDSERLEYERTVERMDSDSTLVTGSTWRDSIASTMTDVSEMYQTAGEDSDNEAVYADEDNDGDDDDELRKTLIDSQLRENVADTTSIGYVSLTGDDKLSEMWEREQNAPLGNPAESEEMINVKGLRIKRDEKDDVETRKLEDAPSPPRQSSEVLDKIDETLKALGENAAAEDQRVFSDDRRYDDDVEGSVDNGVKGFDAARDRLDPRHLELKNHIEFESGDYVDSGDNVDASKPDDDDEIVALQVSSVSLQLQSPVPDGNPKCTIKGSETGHTEQYLDNQEFPADHIARHHEEPETSDTETSETGAEAEEMSVVSSTEVAGTDPDYDVTAATGDDDDTPQISEHSVSSPISAYSSSVRVVLVSNTEGDDFQSDYLRERGVGSDIVKMEDELVLADDSNASNAHQFSLDEGSVLGLGCNSFAHLSEEQKQVDASRSHAELSSDDGGMESSMPLDDEDITTSTAYSHEHEYSSPAVDRFIGVSPRAHETSSESKSHEAAFVSDAREQGLRTKTENDEEFSAEQMAPDSGVGHGVETLSTGIRPEESEEEDAIRGSDRRSIGLIAMSTIDDDEDEAEAAGGTVSAAEHQSWSGGEDEPEPDYSLSSDDDQGDDTTQLDIKDLLITFDPSAMSSDSSEHQDTDVGGNAPLPEYQAEMHAFSMSSSTEPASATDPDEQSAEQISDSNNESADTRTDDFDSWEDDNDNDVPLGNFQRISSIRPSKRGRIKSKRSVVIPPSWSEHPEEEGEVSADTPGAESVFLPFVGETLTIPHPARYDRGPLSVPVSTKDHDKELWTKHSRDSSRYMTGGSDGNQSHRKGFLERRNATRTSKTEGSSDGGVEKEWTKYEVVLRKSQGGFGITLSHSSPVVVFKVQEDGVAAKAGIREGDRILKVNGTLVSNYSHDDVIKCIRSSGLFVILAIQRPLFEIKDHPVPVTPSSIADNTRLSRLNSKSSSSASTRSIGGVSLISSRMSSPPEITDLSHDTVPKPFTDLNFLRQKPAHLAVFLNYLLTEGKPNAMLFTLMADCYQNSIKDTNNSAKRWAYEIYSTFLTPSAPLKLTVDDGMGASVEKMLQRGATNGLLTLFVPITNLVRNDIDSQLKQFVMFWKSEKNRYASDYHLRMMNMDRQLEFQVIEGALWKHFEHCLSEERNDSKHAVAYSLATFFRQIGYSGAKNSNLLENCPTFMSKDKKALKNNMKKHFAHKGHQFTPRQFAAVTQCQLCRKVIWGLGHQAYYCSSCDLSIHRHCTEKIIDVCGRNKDSKRSMRDMIPGRRSQNSVKEELQKNFFLPPFMTDPDDLRNLPMTPVDYIVGSERERLQLPEFTAERSGRSPSRSYSRQVCSSDDSDLEVDSELPQLTDFIPKEELRQMKEKEKKRQQFINELFHTERLHLRVLKVMDKVFYRPMQEDGYIDQEFVSLLFPNLQDLIHIHDGFKKAFVALRKEKAVVDEVGLLLITKFSGSHGEKFKEACAKFCADQAYALNVLRTKQKKDPRYSSFLQEASANSLCKRLELKDFLPRQMQRLTKYPLLIDGLRKNTSPNTEEHGHLTKALELSKNLLQHVNQVVKVVQNQRHLADMQQRLDWRSGDANSLGDYKFLNLTKHSLVYDGEVTWRPYRSRPIELHMVLFEDILVLLQKQDDRLVLRYQMTTVEDTKFPYCPILKLNSLMIRDVATDKRAFFVVDSVSPQVYDLLAHSREEKNKWCNYILDTIKRYTGVHGPYKGGRNRSATQMIDLVSYSKSDGGQALAGDGDLPSNQASDARSVSCHVLQSYDSPDQLSTTPPTTTTTGINVQRVISRLTTSESFGATKLSNTDECDNAAVKDDCGNTVEGPQSHPATFELERRLEELTLCINQLMREKLKLASEDPSISFGDEDDGQFQRNDANTLDAKELVRTALTCVNNLMDLINDQLGNVASSPDLSSGAEERKIAIPAEDLLGISSTLQNLTAQLAVRVTTDDAELERLEEDFRVALDYLKERSSAIQSAAPPVDRHPNDDLTGSSSCSSSIIFGASAAAENAFFPTASQTNIYTAFNEDEPRTFYEHHDQRFSAHSDLLIEGNRSAVLIDEDSTV